MTYWQYHRMVTLWYLGADTYDIAKILDLKESEVANRIASHLNYKKSKAAA